MTREQAVEFASTSPAAFANFVSREPNKWRKAPHLMMLNRLLVEVKAGRIKRLAVFMPPRHGKSLMVSQYFPAWWLGTSPDDRIILAGYGERFAETWGFAARKVLEDGHQAGVFRAHPDPKRGSANDWAIEGHAGGMMTAGVGGSVTGRGADIAIIDDPVKSRQEAESRVYRDRTWEWYTNDFRTRLQPNGRIVLIQTCWHYDDLAARILAADEGVDEWTVLRLPALAEEDDPLGRLPGEALWPKRYAEKELGAIQREMGSYGFAALYQQRPAPREGGMFKPRWFEIVDVAPADAKRVRAWDLAATASGGDYTAGVRMAQAEGIYYVEHVERFQGSPHEVQQAVLRWAELDGRGTSIRMEREPGSAGVTVISHYARALAGYSFRGVPATGAKEVRADPFAAQAEAGNVKLVRGAWNQEYLSELSQFPAGAHDDQVDASSGAFEALSRMGGGDGAVHSVSEYADSFEQDADGFLVVKPEDGAEPSELAKRLALVEQLGGGDSDHF